MKIGFECFNDGIFKSIIQSLHNLDTCEISNVPYTYVYDSVINNELIPYFDQILDVFTPAKYISDVRLVDVGFIEDIISRWNLFTVPKKDIKKILIAVCQNSSYYTSELFNEKVTIKELYNHKFMDEQCILKNYNWDDFCDDIKYNNRFHAPEVNLNQLRNLLKVNQLKISAKSLILYRSRVCDSEHYLHGYNKKEDISAPPPNKASAGRTNSEGIPCLYLSADELTTYHEVRARMFDHITVGKFTNVEDLTIVDLTNLDNITPFADEELDVSWYAVNIEIIKKIAYEISKPMRSFDNVLDYIPTQYVADYIKSLGYDGIKFKSTINKGGINYAFFDSTRLECIGFDTREIAGLEYNTKMLK